jgi:hypothetical protein
MPAQVHKCQCPACLASKENPEWHIHHQMNLLISRLDEQQRRWFAALESNKLGHGGDTLVSQIIGMDVETIRRGRHEMDEELAKRPEERVREEGGGRLRLEKKTHRSKRH